MSNLSEAVLLKAIKDFPYREKSFYDYCVSSENIEPKGWALGIIDLFVLESVISQDDFKYYLTPKGLKRLEDFKVNLRPAFNFLYKEAENG